MAYEPHFYLKKNKEDESTIYLGIQIDGKLFKYYTKYKIIPELFDKKSQRAVTDKDVLAIYKKNGLNNIKVTQMNINTYLDGLYENSTRLIRESLKDTGLVTKENLKQELDYIYKAPKEDFDSELTMGGTKTESVPVVDTTQPTQPQVTSTPAVEDEDDDLPF